MILRNVFANQNFWLAIFLKLGFLRVKNPISTFLLFFLFAFLLKEDFTRNFLFDTLSSFLLLMQFWLWCTFYTNNHPNNSHSAKWCRKMEILCNWKWYSPFNFKLCSCLINLIYTDNPIHIHYVKSWMASQFQKYKENNIKTTPFSSIQFLSQIQF